MHGGLYDMTVAAGPPQALAIKREMTLRSGRRGSLRRGSSGKGRERRQGRNKEEGEAAVEVVKVEFGTDKGEGIGTRQARVAELEKGSQPVSAQASPVRNATDGGLTGEFGKDDEGEDGSERIATSAALAGVVEALEEGKERGGVDREQSRREDESGQQRGRLHVQSFPARWLWFSHPPL
jgi:hypothetical protein